MAQESRQLTAEEELELRRGTKTRSLGLAQIEKARLKQHPRLTFIRFEDANTKFFETRENSRRRKNYIQCLQTESSIFTRSKLKAAEVQAHFDQYLFAKQNHHLQLDFSRI